MQNSTGQRRPLQPFHAHIYCNACKEGLRGKVTLVSAAAGTGKTTILSAWLEQLTSRPASSDVAHAIKVSWLTLDKLDDHLPRFLRYLVTAIEEHFPHSCMAVTVLLQENPNPNSEVVADLLANSLAPLPTPFLLVLDDLHLINNKAIYALLTRLVHHAPATFHLVLSARIDPPLPLNRWRAQGILQELRQQELSLTVEEAAAFLATNLAQAPSAETVTVLHKYTEGWAVGLRLAALALRGHSDPALFLTDVAANSNRYVMDYLCDDVLDQQPATIQQFLLFTAILKRFCPALCAAVLVVDEPTAQQQLQTVERANLFLVALSTPPLWYRYHHQFQSMLLSKLYERYDQPTIRLLYRRAAAWLVNHGVLDEALDYLITIADFARAADLLEQQRVALFNQQRFNELAEAISTIPPALLHTRPLLLMSLAWIYHWQLEQVECAATLQRVEHLLQEEADRLLPPTRQVVQLELVALRASLGSNLANQELIALIQVCWAEAQPYLVHIHSDVITTLANSCQRLGAVETGLAMIAAALEQNAALPPITRCSLLNMRALLYLWDCNIRQAERDFLVNLHQAQRRGFSLIDALCQLGLGAIAHARYQLESAETYLTQVLTDFRWGNGRYAMLSIAKLIELYRFQGCPERAQPLVERLKEYALLVGLPYLHDHVAALEAYVAMACGDLPRALRWALSGASAVPHISMYGLGDRIPMIRARILLAEGSPASLHKGSQLLEALKHYQESQYQWYYLVEVLILQALTWAKREEMEPALAALGQAVQRAVPHGMIGPFIQQEALMQTLLHALRRQVDYKALVELLLASYPATSTPAVDRPDALTEREFAVLRLLAAGLSNKEIAQRLIVSSNTVRNHTANIFSKLQVENRLQAVDRARLLGLLPPVEQLAMTVTQQYH